MFNKFLHQTFVAFLRCKYILKSILAMWVELIALVTSNSFPGSINYEFDSSI